MTLSPRRRGLIFLTIESPIIKKSTSCQSWAFDAPNGVAGIVFVAVDVAATGLTDDFVAVTVVVESDVTDAGCVDDDVDTVDGKP